MPFKSKNMYNSSFCMGFLWKVIEGVNIAPKRQRRILQAVETKDIIGRAALRFA